MITLSRGMLRTPGGARISAPYASTAISRESTRNVSDATDSRALNRSIVTNSKPSKPKQPNPALTERQETVTGGTLGRILSGLFSLTPYAPVSPYKPTPVTVIKTSQPVTKMNFGGAIQTRVSAGGAPPPTKSEATTHYSVSDWNKQINSIPPDKRSVSPRAVAMAPRIDQGSPTLYQGPNAVAIHLASKVSDPNMSAGKQTDSTPVPTDNAGLYFLGIAFFAYMILFRGR